MQNRETALGGADAVPETPDAVAHGARLEGANEPEVHRETTAMRAWIARGRWWWGAVCALALALAIAWLWSAG